MVEKQDGYDELRRVFAQAVGQASHGKGKERHAHEGEPFHEQQIVKLARWSGGIGGTVFQACKKALEATRLLDEGSAIRAKSELLGAMNYLAAAVLVIEGADQPPRDPLAPLAQGKAAGAAHVQRATCSTCRSEVVGVSLVDGKLSPCGHYHVALIPAVYP